MTPRPQRRGPSRSRVIAVALALALSVTGTSAFAQERTTKAEEGRQLFVVQGCYGCHTIGKFGTPIANDLSRVGAKYNMSYLHDWLRDPSRQKPGAHMPKIQMSESDVEALAAYLATLR